MQTDPAYHPVAAIVRLARPYNVLLPTLAIIAGAAMVHARIDWRLILALAAFALVHSAVTIWNDVEDQAVDELNGNHAIAAYYQRGWRRHLVASIWFMLAAAGIMSLWLPLATALWLVVAVVMSWMYNTRPVHASRRPVLSMVVLGICYGLVPVAIGISLGAGTPPPAAWLLAFGWSVGRLSISLLKDYKDARGDAAAAKKTFLLVFGGRWVALASFWLAVAGYLACVAAFAWRVPEASRLVLLVGMSGWLLFERRRLFAQHTYAELDGVFRRCLHYQLAFDGLIALCLIIS